MKSGLVLFLLVSTMLFGVACGGSPATESLAPEATTAPTVAVLPQSEADEPAEMPEDTGAASGGCEDFFRFCVTSTLSGAVNSTATAGMGGNVDDCAAWVAEGDSRVLDLPMMQGAGEDMITVALTRISDYTGPGEYELQAVVNQGMPDMFPAIVAGERTFNNGEGSTAVVTVAADGSGTVEAKGLVEIASMMVSNPDPDARVDFSMQWTCRDN